MNYEEYQQWSHSLEGKSDFSAIVRIVTLFYQDEAMGSNPGLFD